MPHPGPHGHRHDDRTALGLLLLAARRLPGAGENRMTPRLVGDEFHRNEEEVATIYGISMSYAGAGASWLSMRHWEWSARSEEHTSELQSLMPSSYAVYCLKKKKTLTLNCIQYELTLS